MKYVITAYNKLKGERCPVSRAYPLEEAKRLRDVLAARNHSKSAYSHLQVAPAITQLEIPFV